jgi:hypothetical protein
MQGCRERGIPEGLVQQIKKKDKKKGKGGVKGK